MKPRIKTPLINLTCLVCLFISSKGFSFFNAPQNGELIITEVVIADNSAYSFIELRNNTESDLELSGIQLKDNTDNTLYTFGSGTLTPGGLIVLTNASDKFTFENNWGTLNGDVLFIVASNNLNITNAQGWSLEKDITIDEANIGASGEYFLRDVGVSELINTNSNNTASPGELDVVFNGNTDISVLSVNTAAVNVFFNTNTSLPDTQIAAINNMHIASGATLTINGGLTVNGEATNQGQLVVSSDEDSSGSLIANNQVGDLELTYERNILLANRWNSIAAPVTGLTVQDFVNSNDLRVRPSNTDQRYLTIYDHINAREEQTFTQNFIYYNTTDQSVPHNSVLSASNAMMLRKDTVGKYEFSGGLKKDNAVINLVDDSNAVGWHFIGNPYPSFISVEKFLDHNDNILSGGDKNTIFIFDEWRFIWQPLNKSNNALIAPGQSFFVKCNPNGGSLEVTKNMLEHSLNNVFSNPSDIGQNNQVRLRILSNTGHYRYTRIDFNENGTNQIDKNYDASCFKAYYEGHYDLFTYDNNNNPLSIQSINFNELDQEIQIPLGIKLPENFEVNLTLNSGNKTTIDNEFSREWSVIIEDKLNNTFTTLSDPNAAYKITTGSNRLEGNEDRFVIHISSAIVLSNIEQLFSNQVKISRIDDSIYLSGIKKQKIYTNIYDLNGKEIFSSITFNNKILLNKNIQRGIYILRLQYNNKVFSKKILIN